MMLGIGKSNITSRMRHNWVYFTCMNAFGINNSLLLKISYVIKMTAIKFEALGTAAYQTDAPNQQMMHS